jgi:threonine/homoserine/homoserine lactone efflux protein
MDTLLRGVAIGFAIAAPIGPIGILCIRRTLTSGPLVGFVSGVGAAAADAIYAALAGSALAVATHLIAQLTLPLHVAGGLAVIAIGVRSARERPSATAAASGTPRALAGAWASTFALTLVNPTTILSFAGIVAGSVGGTIALSFGAVLAFAAGVFVGSTAWWIVLAGAVGRMRHAVGPRTMLVVGVASGCLLAGFGVATLATLLRR